MSSEYTLDEPSYTDDREGKHGVQNQQQQQQQQHPAHNLNFKSTTYFSADETNSILDSTNNTNSQNTESINKGEAGGIHSNTISDVFSEESTQAIYEEIEVQHQSSSLIESSQSNMRNGDATNTNKQMMLPHDVNVRNGNRRSSGGMNSNYNDRQSPRDIHDGKRVKNEFEYTNKKKHNAVMNKAINQNKNEKTSSSMRFDYIGGKSIDSQEQSISTWFPVPTLSLFQSKPDKKDHQQRRSKRESPRSSPISSPLSFHSIPSDEDRQQITQSNHSTFQNPSPVSSISTSQFKSPSQTTNSHDRVSRRRERPWNINNNNNNNNSNNLHNTSPRYAQVASNGNDIRHASSCRKSPTSYPNLDTIHNSFSSDKSQSIVSPSPKKYRNPFNSSYSSDSSTRQRYRNPFNSSYSSDSSHHQRHNMSMDPTISFHSGDLEHELPRLQQQYQNPFDSYSSTGDLSQQQEQLELHEQQHQLQQKIHPSRRSSKSPIRQRVVKPPLRSNESKLHSLLSCATSPNDPKWMEALQILATSSNPKQIAKMKIPHAHNWTALHIAALSNPPLYLIYALLLVYPEAVKEVDSGGRLPIHLAAGSEASVGVLSILVRFYDESVIMEDERGLIPLHVALLRDAGEEMSTGVIRVLLGQSLNSVRRTNGITRKVKDGCMRRGEHLNFKLSDVKEGIFGDNPNAIHMKEKRKRELRMKSMDAKMGNFSRGFAYDTTEVEPSDGLPFKHEYLVTLWDDESVMDVDIFGDTEMKETQKFSAEVHQLLRKLSKSSKKANLSNEKQENESLVERTVSPASIPTPNSRLPIHMAIKRNFQIAESIQLSLPQQNDILRILIHANPSSLMYRDHLGKTPIFTYLEMIDECTMQQVDLEMVELLLGMRIPGFRVAPQWLEDADIVKSQQQKTNDWYNSNTPCFTVYNPAMVPSIKTLPLHVAALKALPTPIIYAIYYCYTGAKYVQDESSRTPLHCVLNMQSSSSSDLDLDVLCLLIDEKIVRLRDMQNTHVFDLMIENGKIGRIPSSSKNTARALGLDTSDNIQRKVQLQKLFHHGIADFIASTDSYQTYHEIVQKVRHLPPWLRHIVFQTPIVQGILLSRAATPTSFAFIMLNGIVLIMLIIFCVGFIDHTVDQTVRVPQGIVTMLTFSLIYLTLNSLSSCVMAFRLNLGWDYCVISIRSWITFIALVLISWMLRERINFDDSMYRLNVIHTITTIAFLWAMVIGYFSRWCYGVNVFFIRMSKLVQNLMSTLFIFALVVVTYLQMTYLSYRIPMEVEDKCVVVDNDGKEICSVWGSIQSFSFLFLGTEVNYLTNDDSPSVALLSVIFYIVLLFVAVYSVSIAIISIQQIKLKELLVSYYWVPMYVHILLVQDLCNIFSRQKSSQRRQYEHKQNCSSIGNLSLCSGFEQRLGSVWDYVLSSFECVQNKNSKWRSYQQSLTIPRIMKSALFVRLIGIIIIPLWMMVGLLSLGILWPPQCRRWLLTCSNHDKEVIEKEKDHYVSTSKSSNAADSLIKMKCMVFDRFDDMQSELDYIKRELS